jgi:hypothetical protein
VLAADTSSGSARTSAAAADAGAASSLPVQIDPSQLKAQQIAGDTDVPASADTKACMGRYHLDVLKGTVRLCVDTGGAVTALMMTRPSDCEAYNQQLTDAVRGWRFRPYMVDNRPAAVCSAIEFVYANH